jgi:hypothetical protein
VGGGDGERVQHPFVGHLAQEVDAPGVQPGPDLVQQGAPPAPLGSGTAVAGPIRSDQQHLHVGRLGQQPRQGAHEDVEAAQGLEPSVDEGDHRGGAVQHAARAELQAGVGAGADGVGVDPFVDDLGDRLQRRRQLRRLEGRGRHDGARLHIGHRHGRVLRGDAQALGKAYLGELRVEARFRALRMVVELPVQDLPRLGPDLIQQQGLAPARRADDQFGIKSGSLQRDGRRPRPRARA